METTVLSWEAADPGSLASGKNNGSRTGLFLIAGGLAQKPCAGKLYRGQQVRPLLRDLKQLSWDLRSLCDPKESFQDENPRKFERSNTYPFNQPTL